MKRSGFIVSLFGSFILVILVSSFVLLNVENDQEPIVSSAIDWVSDHQVLSLLAVSEGAGLISKKVRGIIQGILYITRQLFFKNNVKPAKALKK